MADLLFGKSESTQDGTSTHEQTRQQEIGTKSDDVLLDTRAAHLEKGQYGELKLSKDGHTVLVPQPSSDPNDPLNWSWRRKHLMLITASLTTFIGDFSSAAGIPLVVLQGQEWGLPPSKVTETINLNVLMLGIGGLFWIILASWWGRAPVLFWSTLAGTLFTLACTITHDYSVYYAFRAMQGLSFTAYQVVGLSVIKDTFYFHEHARKIGIWAGAIIASPFLAPLLANFIVAGTGNWRAVMWLTFGLEVLDLIAVVLFADETYYDRSVAINQQPNRPQTLMGRFSRLLGIWQIQHHNGYFKTLRHSLRRLLVTFLKPSMIPIMIYNAMTFMWTIGINVTSPLLLQTPTQAGGYGITAKQMGYVYFSPFIAVFIGEGFGHFFNDWYANRSVRKHNGIFHPEVRLLTNYLAAALMIPGLLIIGQTLQHHVSIAGIVVGWAVFVVGSMLSTVAITAYALDSYGSASSEVGGLFNFSRVISGFAVGYFQQPWGEKDGFGVSFGIQAAIVAASLVIIGFLQKYGARLRAKAGPVV